MIKVDNQIGRIFLCIAAILGGVGVTLGAVGTHSLKTQLSQGSLVIFETGIRYQMYHALGLLFIGLLLLHSESPPSLLVAAGGAFVLGTLIFSGSLYGLSLTGLNGLGAMTPVGGVALILGWGCLALAVWKT